MDKDMLMHFKNKLLKEEEHYDALLDQMKENGLSEQNMMDPTELSNYDNHPAEIGTQLYELEHNNALVVHVEDKLYQIHEALSRIDKGLYGVCTYCGRDIGEGRLEIIPYTSLCIECEEIKSDDTMLMKRKLPYEQEQLQRTSYRFFAGDDYEFEGMDQWNDLMKYGSSDTPQDIGTNEQYYEDYYTNDTDKQGIVDDMDQVSNDEYKRQLPD
ncbi:MAG: TraR/DksA C4-type zinc finger protein [Bacillota bacterium]|nr:TraR/DksA C4-type zinc finger protein [Bacillota bacterium]